MKFSVKILFLCWLFLLFGKPLYAEEAATAGKSESKVVETARSKGLESPRETLTTFFKAMEQAKKGDDDALDKAATALDLSAINELVRREKGRELAWLLLEVLDRTRVIRLERVSDRQFGKPWIFNTYESGQVVVDRQDDGRWLFTSETLGLLPSFLDELADKKNLRGDDLPWHLEIRQSLPKELKEKKFLLEHWQWLGILLVIFLGFVADRVLAALLSVGVRRWKQKTTLVEDAETLSDKMLRPLGLSAMAILWWAGLNLLGLPAEALVYLLVAVKTLVGLSCIWSAYRLVDVLGLYLHRFASKTDSKVDDILIPLATKSLKVFVSVMGLLFITDALNLNVTGVLASLGIGGLAFALAAKDMVQNLFGSVTVLLDRTFRVGDWIIVDGIEGSVESIGLRSTKIRTFYNSLIILPNSRFITASVDNMGDRRYRRYKAKIALTYDTPPDKIEAFCEGVREIVRLHPYMRKDYFHVYLNEMGAASLDVLVYVFWKVPEWGTELRERHRFLLDIIRLASRLGVEFAYPTQTIYWKRAEEGVSGEGGDSLIPFDQERASNAQKVAGEIVDKTTGIGKRPPPVTF